MIQRYSDIYRMTMLDGNGDYVLYPDHIAALEAVKVTVRPLEWIEAQNTFPAEKAWTASSALGIYTIEQESASDCASFVLFRGASPFAAGAWEGLPEAKAAAQADYERRVLSALEAKTEGE